MTDELNLLKLENEALREALAGVIAAALSQLAYMGKGVPPSPKLRAAIAVAEAALNPPTNGEANG